MTRRIEQQLEDYNDHQPDLEMSIPRVLIMSRARAEREGRSILGPADVAADGDFVRVES